MGSTSDHFFCFFLLFCVINVLTIGSVPTILFLQNRVAYVRDEGAYRQIFLHFHPALFRFAYHILRNSEAAEDVVSDVMIKIWTMESRLSYIENLKLYLLKSVKNAALSYLSDKKNQTESIEAITEPVTANEETAQKLLLSEAAQRIEAAITALPPQCQQVLRLVKEEGLSYKEVGKVLDISQNTIETHIRIALKRLKIALDEYLLTKK